MTRAEFTAEFRRGMRFVIQKHDRVLVAQQAVRDFPSMADRKAMCVEAQTNLDAAIDQLADHVFDGIEGLDPADVGAR